MKELRINASKSKKLESIKVFIFLSVILMVANLVTYFQFGRIFIILIALFLLFLGVLLLNLKDILKKDKTALILNHQGISSLSTENGRTAGLVEWRDVDKITFRKVKIGTHVHTFLSVLVKDNKKYLQRFSNINKAKDLRQNNVAFNIPDELEMDHNDLAKKMNDYFKQYKG